MNFKPLIGHRAILFYSKSKGWQDIEWNPDPTLTCPFQYGKRIRDPQVPFDDERNSIGMTHQQTQIHIYIFDIIYEKSSCAFSSRPYYRESFQKAHLMIHTNCSYTRDPNDSHRILEFAPTEETILLDR